MFSRHWTSVSSLERCEPLARVDSSERTVQVKIGVLIGLNSSDNNDTRMYVCLVLLEFPLTEHWGCERRFTHDVDVPNHCRTIQLPQVPIVLHAAKLSAA